MTLQESLQAVFADCGYGTAPGAAVQARITRYCNEGVRVILSEPGMDRLLDSDVPYTFASVLNQARYAIPAGQTIQHITEQTNDRTLRVMALGDYRRYDPDPASHSGTPSHYVPIGRVAVATVPSAAAELFVKSTSASDVGWAFLEGTITGGYVRTVSIKMTGTTAVSLSTVVTTFIDVTDFYISASAVGTVTLHQTSGLGTELAQITIGQTRQSYTGFYLWPTPSAPITYLVDTKKNVTDLVQSTDEPPLPHAFHPMIPAYARMREWEMKGEMEKLLLSKQQWDRWLSRLKYAVRSDPDALPVAGRRRRVGYSRLGAWTPADDWSW